MNGKPSVAFVGNVLMFLDEWLFCLVSSSDLLWGQSARSAASAPRQVASHRQGAVAPQKRPRLLGWVLFVFIPSPGQPAMVFQLVSTNKWPLRTKKIVICFGHWGPPEFYVNVHPLSIVSSTKQTNTLTGCLLWAPSVVSLVSSRLLSFQSRRLWRAWSAEGRERRRLTEKDRRRLRKNIR